MSHQSALATVSALSAPSLGVFRGTAAVKCEVSRNQLSAMCRAGLLVREFPDTYRITAVPESSAQLLRAALLWGGDDAAAASRSAAEVYGLEGVRAPRPEIVVAREVRLRSTKVVVHRTADRRALRLRRHRGVRVTGVEPTLMALADACDSEDFEVACEDARRRRHTSIPALHAYLHELGTHRPGATEMRRLLQELDPVHASRSTLEVKTRRLLVAHGLIDFVREFPLAWNGRTHLFDFGFEGRRTILETNGRRWHDDPTDYEHDNEKWSVPGRHGFRIVFATWQKVTQQPRELLAELVATLAA